MRWLITLVLLCIAPTAFAADQSAAVYLDGKLLTLQPGALVRAGTAYVPLRAGGTALGLSVEWLPAENAAKVCDASRCQLIRKSECLVVNGSLYLPLRKMARAFAVKVYWDGPKRAVMLRH